MTILVAFLIFIYLFEAEYCNNENRVDIIGGNDNRIITEGSQVTLTCCTKFLSTIRRSDHLLWKAPDNTEIPDYFSLNQYVSKSYSLIDYSKSDRLVSRLVISNFSDSNAGRYSCQSKNSEINVQIYQRPNLIIGSDVTSSLTNSTNPVITGQTKVEMFESNRPASLACRTNSKYQAKITWFFHSKILIPGTSSAMGEIGASDLNIEILDDMQKLYFKRADSRHRGLFICKVEITNPFPWYGESATSENNGFVIGDYLVQNQAYDVTIFSKPSILPGHPKSIHSEIKPTFFNKMLNNKNLNKTDELVVPEGNNMTMECGANGFPSPVIYWFRGAHINGKIKFFSENRIDTSQLDSFLRGSIQKYGLKSDFARSHLGHLIAEGDRLIDLNNDDFDDKLIQDHNSTKGLGSEDDPIFGLKSERGRYMVFAGKKSMDGLSSKMTVSQLTIRNIQRTDATVYTCVAVLETSKSPDNYLSVAVSSFFPKVVFKPKFIPEKTSLNLETYPGETVELKCEAFGGLSEPNGLKIYFVRGSGLERYRYNVDMEEFLFNLLMNPTGSSGTGIEFIGVNSVNTENYHVIERPLTENPYAAQAILNISNMRSEDNSDYLCFATSGYHWASVYPHEMEKLGRLTVFFKPTIMKEEEATEVVYASIDETNLLSCKARGMPMPTWTWTKSSSDTDLKYIETSMIDGEYSISNLTVPATWMVKNIFGTYTCKANNSLGTDTKTLRLKMAYHPGQPNVRDCAVDSIRKVICIEPPKDTGGFPILYYDVRVKLSPNGKHLNKGEYRPDIESIDLSDVMSENYNYISVLVAAVTKAGKGMSGSIELDKSSIDREKPKLQILENNLPTLTSYKLEWRLLNPKSTVVKEYIINCRPVYTYVEDYNRVKISEKYPDQVHSHLFTNLLPGTEYEINLIAATEPTYFSNSDTYKYNFKTSSNTRQKGEIIASSSSGFLKYADEKIFGNSSNRIFNYSIFSLILCLVTNVSII